MAKLTKHAEVLSQLHSMVKKQAAEAQKNISGAPGEDVKSVSVSKEHEHTNKNSVGPENVAQGYSQKPSEDPSEPVASAKTAGDLGAEILDIIRKEAEAQDTVTGKPGDVKSESVDDSNEHTDKNAVKPENNKQHYSQKGSTDESEPVASAKKAEVEELAAKVASYELGRQFCAALLKAAADQYEVDETSLMKEAGRRDFDMLIAQAAEELESFEKEAEEYYDEEDLEKFAAEQEGAEYFDSLLLNEKQAEEAELAGAEHFDALIKDASLQEAVAQNEQLLAKIAEYENYFHQVEAHQAALEHQEKLAESVAETVITKLKTEPSSDN